MASLESTLLRQLARLNRSFGLIDPHDVVMVACSGGKDSWALLHLLRAYQRRVPFPFSIIAMNLDQGHPGFDAEPMRQVWEDRGFDYVLEREDTHRVVVAATPPGKAYCSRCSRMRRAVLHRVAQRIGANKIALGHHRDDAIETVMLNMMFSGRIRAMPAVLPACRGGAAVIRPVLSCAEADLARYAASLDVPILPCDLCGSQPDLRRQRVKRWLAELEGEIPDLRRSMFASLARVEPSHLLDPAIASFDDDAVPEQEEPPPPPTRTRLNVLAST